MFLRKSFNKGKAYATALVVGGVLLLIKFNQDARYMLRDIKVLSETDLNDRDLEQVKKKFKLSSAEMNILKLERARKTQVVDNVIEEDPSFEHKRAKGMD